VDHELLEVWLDHLAVLQPDGVDIIGDLIDCYMLSRFDKNPTRKTNIQDEIDLAHAFLVEMRKLAGDDCDIRFNEGNHENRLKKLLWGKSKELAPLRNLSIPQLFDLKSLGIKYYVPEKPYQIRGVWYIHGDLARKSNWSMTCGGMGAKAVMGRIQGNVIMGHTHQMGDVYFRSWDGLREGVEVGCMCRYNLEYIVGVPQWQQGWAVVEFPPEGGHCVDFVRVQDVAKGRIVIYRGQVIAKIGPAKQHVG
jgi:hypothetical protein